MATFFTVGTEAIAAKWLVVLLSQVVEMASPFLSPYIIIELGMLCLDLFESPETCLCLLQIGSQAKQFIMGHIPFASLEVSEQSASLAHI